MNWTNLGYLQKAYADEHGRICGTVRCSFPGVPAAAYANGACLGQYVDDESAMRAVEAACGTVAPDAGGEGTP